eukprot:TRINITY_DN62005_c0_g1_i1.p1 TRINITY_DN62005_c0_g1~~TRINITY_DN62005_c0_g1_i1.p1  ORF type:complete len:344 (+),score=69.42 TRINITY_DN62005_c0_g1_i1:233-1264(+)
MPGPADPAMAAHLNEKHQEYLAGRKAEIQAREAEYQQLQAKLARIDEIKPESVSRKEAEIPDPLYTERMHSRLPFGHLQDEHQLYATQWKLRPERAAAGHRYVGDLVGGQEHGVGVYTSGDGKYCGEWRDGKEHGMGVFEYENGDCYKGQWENGHKSGHGSYHYETTGKYDGEWANDKRHGRGTYVTQEGAKYEGEWSDGTMSGQGKVLYADGSVYDGAWYADMEHGHGRHTQVDGDVYEGEWEAGVKHGHGTVHYPDGTCYHGIWVKGEDTHDGTFSNSDGTELGSNLRKERPMLEPPHQSARNTQFGLEFPYRFSVCKLSGDFGGGGKVPCLRGVPHGMRR